MTASTSRRTVSIAGGVLVVLLLLAALWYTNRSGPAPAKVGDCVTAPQGGKFSKVGCGGSDAEFQVIASYDGHDSNRCNQNPDTVVPVLANNGTKEWILCLRLHK